MPTDFKDYKQSQRYLELLIGIYNARFDLATQHRELRRLEIDVVTNRQAGRLEPDELMIPQRVIDTNIRREQSRYISYLTTSRRAGVFIDILDNSKPTDVIEKDYTYRVRYDGWEQEAFKAIDAMQLHRYSSFELSLDQALPGQVRFTYIPFEDLLFPDDTKDLQACQYLGKALHYSKTQLEILAKKEGINKSVMDQLTQNDPTTKPVQSENSLTTIYQFFFRVGLIVYQALYASQPGQTSAQGGASNRNTMSTWLRDPQPLHLGKYRKGADGVTLQPIYETSYPFVLLPYNISEDNTIYNALGRADLDQYTQDAATSLVSSYTTGVRRASGMYWAEDGLAAKSSSTVAMTDVTIVPNRVIKGNIKQFQLQPPDQSVIATVNTLLSLNQQETSQINYAALNRKDSEKTATEIDAAQNESNMLSAAQLSLFSNSIRELLVRAWDIISNRVLMGHIEITNPALLADYGRKYSIRPAGDVDVVERQQRIAAMMQAWPVIGKTGAAQEFLKDILLNMFPDRAATYIAAIDKDQVKDQLLGQAAMLIKELATGPDGKPTPEVAHELPQLRQFMLAVQQVLQPQPQK